MKMYETHILQTQLNFKLCDSQVFPAAFSEEKHGFSKLRGMAL